jgi:ABC-2 family transporter protein
MNITTARLALRLHRLEIVVLGLLMVLGIGLTVLGGSLFDASGFSAACAHAMQTGGDFSLACQQALDAFDKARSSPIVSLSEVLRFAVPFLLAALVGVALVGRELERGTARLAWSLAPSRARWFAGRLAPMLGVVLLVALASGLASDRMLVWANPGMDPYASLLSFGDRGVDFAARVVFAFGCAVLVGALLGRTLPALLFAIILVFVGLAGGSSVHGRILASEATPAIVIGYNPADLSYDSGYLAPDGHLITWEEMARIDGVDVNNPGNWTPSYPQATNRVPGLRYPFVVAREVAVLLAGATVALGLSFVVVRRARPG